jgi:lipopolysaccharide export system protein LptC
MNQLTAASIMEDSRAGSFSARSRAEGDRIFRRAVRHSRFVRFLRVVVPFAIAAILAIIIAVAYFKPFQVLAKLPIDPSKLVISGTKVTMEQPRLAGFTRDARPYELSARAASQDIARPGVLELKDIHARVQMQDKVVIDLSAASGVYETKADVLKLADDILFSSSSGYQVRLSEAVVDMKKGAIVSERPVEVTLPNGTILANRLEVADNGAMILFDQGVEMFLTLQPDRPVQQKASAP